MDQWPGTGIVGLFLAALNCHLALLSQQRHEFGRPRLIVAGGRCAWASTRAADDTAGRRERVRERDEDAIVASRRDPIIEDEGQCFGTSA
jgi:hypothetical protein